MKRALLYLQLLIVLVAIFLIHNHSISAYQPTSRGIGLIIIGAALGVSATLLQGFFQDTYSDVGLLGISSGATIGASIALLSGAKLGSYLGISISILFAFISFYKYRYLKARFKFGGILLLLAYSLIIFLLNLKKSPNSLFWTLGSFTQLNKIHVRTFAPFVEVGIITSFFIARKLFPNKKSTAFFVAVGTAFLIGPFTNITGAVIGFGAFIPTLTKKLINGDTRRILSYAALVGPIILLLLDIAINHLNEISISVLSIPLFLVLSRFSKQQAQG